MKSLRIDLGVVRERGVRLGVRRDADPRRIVRLAAEAYALGL